MFVLNILFSIVVRGSHLEQFVSSYVCMFFWRLRSVLLFIHLSLSVCDALCVGQLLYEKDSVKVSCVLSVCVQSNDLTSVLSASWNCPRVCVKENMCS